MEGTSGTATTTAPRRGQLKCDGTRAETRFRLSAKRKSPFKSAGSSVQSTTDTRRVRISGSNAGYAMFRDSVKGTGYPLHSPVSPSFPLPCVTVCHHISTGLYILIKCLVLLSVFAELRKAVITFVLSVRLSVREDNSAPIRRIFMIFDIWEFFENLSRKLKFH